MNGGGITMKRRRGLLLLAIVCCLCLAACAQEKTTMETEETTEKNMTIQKEPDSTKEAVEKIDITRKPSTGETEKINKKHFEDLPKAAEQVGFSFRALEEFKNYGSPFFQFNISEERQEVNGMELAKPYPVVTIQYQKGIKKIDMTIFPYEGENIQSTIREPICYVSTKEINGVDVYLTEYILCMVPEDYEMTEADYEFMNSEKGSFSCDFVSDGEVYFRTMYWVKDGIYYEMNVREENVPVEEIEQLVSEYMNAEMQ